MPVFPQAPSESPVWQLLVEQQPPLQSWVALQALVHACVVVLHAMNVGQSVATLQPHVVLPTQMWPAAFPAQFTQAAGF